MLKGGFKNKEVKTVKTNSWIKGKQQKSGGRRIATIAYS